MTPRRTFAALLAAVSVAGLTACGDDGTQSSAESEGTYVTVDGLRYQVEISRQLNPTDVEDRGYLTGVSAADSVLPPDDVWFGVFIRVENKSDHAIATAPEFTIEDTQENEFKTIEAHNLIGYTPTTLTKDEIYPRPIEVAASGPTQGKLLLYKMPTDTLSNRPLELTIFGADGSKGTVTLDV